MVGFAMGMVYNSSFSIVPRYFDKYKATAAGISMCGVGVGAFVFPPIIKALIDTYGWRGTFLMIGGAIIDVKETIVDELDFNILLKGNGGHAQDTIYQNEENGPFSQITIEDKNLSQTNKTRNNLFLKMFTQPVRCIENLELFKSEDFMEYYWSGKKGAICTAPISSE